MKIKLDLEGMKFELQIENYNKDYNQDDNFIKATYSFEFKDIIKYRKENDEVFLSSEINKLRDYLKDLLDDKMDDIIDYNCVEPDFEFIFNPRDKENDIDIDMELRLYLYNPMLTCNYISVLFNRDNTEKLYLYLSLITDQIKEEDKKIKELINKQILIK